MEWFYARDGRQNGPISESQLTELRRLGTIDPETLVWQSGMSEWQPVRVVLPALAAPPILSPASMAASAAMPLCAECRRPFPQNEMVMLNNCRVCAACKPLFLQRMKEGGAPAFTATTIWRHWDQMVLQSKTPMPDRCVRCNEPANGYRLKRNFSWHPSAYYLLILLNLLIYAIVALLVRKKAMVMVGLCERHRNQRRWFVISAWLAFLGGVGMVIMGFAFSGWLAFAGVIAVLAGLVLAILTPMRIVYATRIDKEFVWVKGAGASFLDSLPDWSGH